MWSKSRPSGSCKTLYATNDDIAFTNFELLKKLYLDIDGVLLTTKRTTTADFSVTFIDFVTSHFDCYWLTTHCKGNINYPLDYLANYFDNSTLEKLKKIKPTNWTTLKTEGIDFASEFFWLDDNPFVSEINILTSHSANDRLIKVDLHNPDELKRVMEILKTRHDISNNH